MVSKCLENFLFVFLGFLNFCNVVFASRVSIFVIVNCPRSPLFLCSVYKYTTKTSTKPFRLHESHDAHSARLKTKFLKMFKKCITMHVSNFHFNVAEILELGAEKS